MITKWTWPITPGSYDDFKESWTHYIITVHLQKYAYGSHFIFLTGMVNLILVPG